MNELRDLRLSVRTMQRRGEAAVIALAGECDLYEADLLEDALQEAVALAERCVYVDLSELEFLDSTGLHVLLKAQRTLEAAGAELVLVAPSAAIRRTLAVAGVDGRLQVRDLVDDLVVEADAAAPDERLRAPVESLFRSVNECILELSADWGDGELHFFCECGDGDCTRPVRILRDTYERLQAVPRSAVVSSEHEAGDGWDVVERGEGYLVVRERGAGRGSNGRAHPV